MPLTSLFKFVNWITGTPTAIEEGVASAFTLTLQDQIITAMNQAPFLASGANHRAGFVPDPGAVAGTTKYLNENATFKQVAYTDITNTPTLNLLINSNGVIDQRNVGAAATTNDDTYGSSDRWYSLTQTASITVQRQQNGEDGNPWFQRLTQPQAAAQRMGRAQIIEGKNCTFLRGSNCVLSGRIRCSSSQPIRYAIIEWSGTEDTVTSDIVLDWTSSTYTINNFFINSASLSVISTGSITPSANTWTTLTELTLAASTNLNNIIVFIWTEGTAAQNVTLDIGWVKLEKGSVATSWYPPLTNDELENCQRYYWQTYGNSPGIFNFIGYQAAGVSFTYTLTHPTPMRTSPTATKNGTWAVSNCGQPTLTADANFYLLSVTVTGLGAFQYFPNSTDDTLTFSAEL